MAGSIEVDSKQLISQIPRLFYDLIARIVPGIIISAIFYIMIIDKEFHSINGVGNNFIGSSILLILLISFGYAFGILLTPFGYLFQLIECVWIGKYINANYKKYLDDNKIDSDRFRLFMSIGKLDDLKDYLHERARTINTHYTDVLSKMRAEISLSNNLAVGFLFLIISVNIIPTDLMITQFHLMMLWCAFLLSFISSVYRSWKLVKKAFSYNGAYNKSVIIKP